MPAVANYRQDHLLRVSARFFVPPNMPQHQPVAFWSKADTSRPLHEAPSNSQEAETPLGRSAESCQTFLVAQERWKCVAGIKSNPLDWRSPNSLGRETSAAVVEATTWIGSWTN